MALEQFYAWLEGRNQSELGPVTQEGMDQYPLLESSNLKDAHRKISALLEELVVVGGRWGRPEKPTKVSLEMLAAKKDESTRYALALLERTIAHELELATDAEHRLNHFFHYGIGPSLVAKLMHGADVGKLRRPVLEWLASQRNLYYTSEPLVAVLPDLHERPPNEEERALLIAVRCHLTDGDGYGHSDELTKQIDSVLGDGMWDILAPVEVWGEEATQELQALEPQRLSAWKALLLHCRGAKSAKPTGKWLKAAAPLLEAVGEDDFRERVTRWFGRVDAARVRKMLSVSWDYVDDAQRIHDRNGDVLRGLLWLSPPLADAEMLRAIRNLALSAYRKVRGLGPRAVKVGNAAVASLGEIGTVEAVGQLAILKVRVKFGTAQKGIEKALIKTAEKAGVPREELEEMAVPTYGLAEVGRRAEELGEHRGEIVVENNKVGLHWFKSDKQMKSVPKAVKDGFPDELKELRAAQKDIQRMLPAQAARVEDAYRFEKNWDFGVWRERYADHPLVGTVARRLIWTLDGVPSILVNEGLVTVDGKTVKPATGARVALWHPLNSTTDEIVAWRRFIEERQIRQPFKQAHRELYRLTDAERNTDTYSNRFAAHVVKQHQFNSLIAARGWKHQLRLMVDDSYTPAHVNLPHWNLRAEFWVEGVGTEYGTDTTESGAYLYLATDQVRFYRIDAADNVAHAGGGGYETYGEDAAQNHPLPLDQVPALALSEVLRDVDLFVGVASVGNDPNWSDGGPEGRFREYWTNYSFGELSASARTRKDVLERLLPKLKISGQCELRDRWLVVRGDLRTYKIHLGSGNILMEPNDQYLCIVPKQTVSGASSKVFLPFEGDNMMAVVLSKAFLLADDKKITDGTILSQMDR